ncbi:conserved hypothetical protein [Rubrivivax sp. A210]|uniref:PilN domain-containing protein n=1 Tax=Rubrivivax sp. A210 TaxID=2772301 RepID=UPI00191ABFA2|nr:PilN domain-containing protein [Rubrivivax sp. A210]CAD5370287.1 conserved hypothetical protein [Rubrivivax sp. A210]
MAQQINLCNPILLAPRRLFSSRRMAQALAVLVLGVALLCGWAAWSTVRLRAGLMPANTLHAAERQRLLAAGRAALPGNEAALQQELAQVQGALGERQQLLQALSQGRAGSALGPVAQLSRLARTLPESAWLSEIRLRDGRLALVGRSLQPETLPRWLDRLAADAGGPRLQLSSVAREGVAGGAAGADAWRFEAGVPPPPAAASGVQP